jgi:transketolase C-terminal domain/subunit
MKLHEKELRAVYTDTLIELMTENSNVVCLEADLGKSSGTVPRVWEAFPDRFFDVGVAEANMIGISAGLANEGMVPFCATRKPGKNRGYRTGCHHSQKWRHAHVLSGPGDHACHAEHARLLPGGCL